MTPRQVGRFGPAPPEAERLLAAVMSQLAIPARGHDRGLKVALTIADLAGVEAFALDRGPKPSSTAASTARGAREKIGRSSIGPREGACPSRCS